MLDCQKRPEQPEPDPDESIAPGDEPPADEAIEEDDDDEEGA